ncbi:hypothetical protein DL765_008178 [Monosporascus sp. GIB2]|nr:hypothetical protein DL765_008178 [Monosporascus sp. GIB2]
MTALASLLRSATAVSMSRVATPPPRASGCTNRRPRVMITSLPEQEPKPGGRSCRQKRDVVAALVGLQQRRVSHDGTVGVPRRDPRPVVRPEEPQRVLHPVQGVPAEAIHHSQRGDTPGQF